MNLLQGRSQTKTDLYLSGNPGKLIEVSQDGRGVRMGKASFGIVVKQVGFSSRQSRRRRVGRAGKSRKSELRRGEFI
jgi:hypothetical protein